MAQKVRYVRPQTLPEALAILAEGQSKVLAGGTDLLVQMNRGAVSADCLVDIKGLREFHELKYIPGQGLFIGSGVTVNELITSDAVGRKFPAIKDAAKSLASYQLRNRATLAGNICNASPAADLAPPLLVFAATVQVASLRGTRNVPINEFFCGPKQTALCPDELVTGVMVPDVPQGDRSIYLKSTRIKGHDLGIVGLAVRCTREGRFLLAMSSVAPTPIRLAAVERYLEQPMPKQKLVAGLASEVHNCIKPISDVRSSAEYRYHLAEVLVQQAVLGLLGEGGEGDVQLF